MVLQGYDVGESDSADHDGAVVVVAAVVVDSVGRNDGVVGKLLAGTRK